MLDLPPTEAVLAVLAAAQRGSFSAAAVDLGVTHGAVSRRVQAVEHWLGTPVFERHGRGVRATPLGSLFISRATRSLTELAAIAQDVRSAQKSNAIRLSVLPSVARLWVLPRMQDLQGHPADIEIQLLTTHRLLSLQDREADLAVRAGAGDWPGVNSTLLFSDRLTPVAAPAVAARVADRGLAAIMAETLLFDSVADDWRTWCQQAGIEFQPLGGVRNFEDHDLVLSAAEAGLGVALLRRPLADEVLRRGTLTALDAREVASQRGHFVVTRHNERRTGVLRLAQRLIEAAASF